MVWALTPVDTVRGTPPSDTQGRPRIPRHSDEFEVQLGLANLFSPFDSVGTQKHYIFAAGTYKVGRKGASLAFPSHSSCIFLLLMS
jgi:hypothetical protein